MLSYTTGCKYALTQCENTTLVCEGPPNGHIKWNVIVLDSTLFRGVNGASYNRSLREGHNSNMKILK